MSSPTMAWMDDCISGWLHAEPKPEKGGYAKIAAGGWIELASCGKGTIQSGTRSSLSLWLTRNDLVIAMYHVMGDRTLLWAIGFPINAALETKVCSAGSGLIASTGSVSGGWDDLISIHRRKHFASR